MKRREFLIGTVITASMLVMPSSLLNTPTYTYSIGEKEFIAYIFNNYNVIDCIALIKLYGLDKSPNGIINFFKELVSNNPIIKENLKAQIDIYNPPQDYIDYKTIQGKYGYKQYVKTREDGSLYYYTEIPHDIEMEKEYNRLKEIFKV